MWRRFTAAPPAPPPPGPDRPDREGGKARTASGRSCVMKKGLRSRLAQYGDEEFALFLRRGFLKGAGFTDEVLDRPIVGILSTASDFNPCHATAGRLADGGAGGG